MNELWNSVLTGSIALGMLWMCMRFFLKCTEE